MEGGGYKSKREKKKCRVYKMRDELPNEVIQGTGIFPSFFRREKFGGERFESLTMGEDRLWVAKCLVWADEIVMDGRKVYGYRQRGDSAMHSAWTVRKVESVIDYMVKGLGVYSGCGKKVGMGAMEPFSGILLAECPKWLARVGEGADEGWAHWIKGVGEVDTRLMRFRFRVARRILLCLRFSRRYLYCGACILRSLGLTRIRKG